MATPDGHTRLHGEYKAPGAKLVVVDFDVEDGRIARAHLSGDFFLEPDDVLDDLDGALNGTSVEDDAATIAERVEQRLAARTDTPTLIGISAHGIAVAVRRALGEATDWAAYDWQLVHTDPQPPLLHMALDQVLLEEVAAGRRAPTLRFWEWGANAVIIGSFQSYANEVDPAGAERYDVQVVRRISGGGAMFVEPGNTITYSLYAPADLVRGLSYVDSYAYLDDWVLGALGDLGVRAWYQPINDIATDAGKIGGAAQKRLADGAVLHHVTMSYDIDADKMVQVLRIGREKLKNKGTTSAKKRVDPLRRQTGIPREDVIGSMIGSFKNRYGLTSSDLTAEELARAEELVRTKFATPEWLHRVP